MHDIIDVLDHGFIRLEGYSADDLGVVNAARVSFNKKVDSLSEGDGKLIHYLMRNRHGTPFEHNMMKFHVKAPIFVFREWHRHRIGISINEWSARYSELKAEYYIPDFVRVQTGKPGHYTYEAASESDAASFRCHLRQSCEEAFATYQEALEHGIAKEQARLCLPVNTYSEMYWTCNARSLMAFLSLRNHEKAQWEIRQYAVALELFFTELMPITASAFIERGRVAP